MSVMFITFIKTSQERMEFDWDYFPRRLCSLLLCGCVENNGKSLLLSIGKSSKIIMESFEYYLITINNNSISRIF